MDIRQAILKAADWIESNPSVFNFMEIRAPDCNTPGCALGWIGHFVKPGSDYTEVARDILCLTGGDSYGPGSPHFEFYSRMSAVSGGDGWMHGASACAAALRLYADKYHPATVPNWEQLSSPIGVPVRELVSQS